MLDTGRPFDVNTIEEEVTEVIQSTYDPSRTRASSQGVLRRTLDRLHSESVAPLREDHPQDASPDNDPVNHPQHYTSHPSGIECIQITEWMNFNRGNAVKYIWRADEKGDPIENLEKAVWYLTREINRLKR